jgi:hypothetical protein
MRHRTLGCEAEGNAGARAAAIECEHEARLFGRAAIHARPQIQAAVIAVHFRTGCFDSGQTGIPDQRTIAEQPQIALTVPVAQRAFKRRAQLFLR